MGMQGTTTVDFGAGAMEATVTVTGQAGLTATSLVEAWPAWNGDDTPWVEQIRVIAGNITPDTGSGGSFQILVKPDMGKAIGVHNICWVWN